MAGYRNRMVHFHAAVSQAELYDLRVSRLGDVEAALTAIRRWVAAGKSRSCPGLNFGSIPDRTGTRASFAWLRAW